MTTMSNAADISTATQTVRSGAPLVVVCLPKPMVEMGQLPIFRSFHRIDSYTTGGWSRWYILLCLKKNISYIILRTTVSFPPPPLCLLSIAAELRWSIFVDIYYRFIVRFPIGLDFLFISFTFLLHLLLSWTSSLSITSSAISTFTLSNHVCLGLPTGLLPSTPYISSPSPHHLFSSHVHTISVYHF